MVGAIVSNIRRLKRFTRHIGNSAWNVAERLFYPLGLLVVTPWLITWIGSEKYGLLMLVNAIVAFSGVGNLGIGAATIKHVSSRSGIGDLDGAAGIMRASLSLSILGSVVVAVLVIAVAYVGIDLVLSRMGSTAEVRMVLLFAAVMIPLEQLDGVFTAVIKGMERFGEAARREMFARLLLLISMTCLAWGFRDLGPILLAMLGIALLRVCLKGRAACTLLGVRRTYPAWEPRYIKEVFRFGSWAWLNGVAGALFASADRLLVGSFLGADALGRYAVCLQLAQLVHAIPTAAMTFVFPLASRKHAAGGRNQFRQLAIWAVGANIGLVGVLGLPLFLFPEQVLSAWLGANFASGLSPTLLWLTAAFSILAVSVAPHFLLLGHGEVRFVSLVNIIAGSLVLFASVLLIPINGLVGAAQARVVFSVAILIYFYVLRKLI